MILDKLDRFRDLGLLIARLGFGLGFAFFHGWPKLAAGPEMWTAIGGAVGNFGIGFGHQWFGLAAALAEFAGGLCIAAGFLFRAVSLVMAFVMLTASVNHVVTGQGTAAHAFKNMFVFLGFVLIGPGRYSVDHLMSGRRADAAGGPVSPGVGEPI